MTEGPGAAAEASPRVRGGRISDFLTDGSLIALCDELGRLAGAEVRVREPDGRCIVRGPGTPPWTIVPMSGSAALSVPVRVLGRVVGSLDVLAGSARTGDLDMLERTLALLASTVAEVCERDLELEHRLKEISVLYRLSGMLARAGSVDEIMDIGLDSALDVLDLDAGSLVLLPPGAERTLGPDEAGLILKASRNLSRAWLDDPMPVSRGRVFDELALGGQGVAVEDLLADDRVQNRASAAREGLRGFINAGMVHHGRPIGVIRLYSRSPRRFTPEEQGLLQSIAHQLAVAVEQARLLRLQEEDRRIHAQLRLAADVQRRMMPRVEPRVGRLEIAARWQPSFELGGDFYDFMEMPDGRLGLVIGDVVGKGIAAALLMSSVRASVRAHAAEETGPEAVLARVNRDLCRDTREHEFVTIWYGVIDPVTLEGAYCSAGHDPPIVLRLARPSGAEAGVPRPSGADPPRRGELPTNPPEIIDLDGGGLIAGIDPAYGYQSAGATLQPGDIFIATTDGVPDTMDFSGRKFGRARLKNSLREFVAERPGATAAEVLDRVFRELRQFGGLAGRSDDQTVVVVRVVE